jgi:hypothetical protein
MNKAVRKRLEKYWEEIDKSGSLPLLVMPVPKEKDVVYVRVLDRPDPDDMKPNLSGYSRERRPS